jgi:hypothetical protein
MHCVPIWKPRQENLWMTLNAPTAMLEVGGNEKSVRPVEMWVPVNRIVNDPTCCNLLKQGDPWEVTVHGCLKFWSAGGGDGYSPAHGNTHSQPKDSSQAGMKFHLNSMSSVSSPASPHLNPETLGEQDLYLQAIGKSWVNRLGDRMTNSNNRHKS